MNSFRLMSALEDLQCFSCGCRVTRPINTRMREVFLEHGRDYDAGKMLHNGFAEMAAPYWRRGECPMCQPVRDALAAPTHDADWRLILRDVANRLIDRRAMCSRSEVIAAYNYAIEAVRAAGAKESKS